MTVNVNETGGDFHMSGVPSYYTSGTVTANPAWFSVTIDQIPATTDTLSMDRISVLERKLKAMQVSEEFHETNEQTIQRNYNFFKNLIPPRTHADMKDIIFRKYKDEYRKICFKLKQEDEFEGECTPFNERQCNRCKRLGGGDPCPGLCQCNCHDLEEKDVPSTPVKEGRIYLPSTDGSISSFERVTVPVLKLPPAPKKNWFAGAGSASPTVGNAGLNQQQPTASLKNSYGAQ